MVQLLATFFIISLTGALAPGPLTTMAIVEGSRQGKGAGWWLVVGHALVEGPYMAVIALILWWGQAAMLNQPLVAGLIALVGGGFLAWMGWSLTTGAWRGQLTLAAQPAQNNRLGLAPTGIMVTLSNPYWWIWWALVTPLYIGQALAWGVVGVALLFAVHWATDAAWLIFLAWLIGSGRSWLSPRLYRWVMVICGALLLFFGLSFIVAGFGFWWKGITL
jgi:threonine/homoserine/homoserine lactone efflux protein